MSLRGAKLIDYTGNTPGFEKHSGFGEPVIQMLRNGGESKVLVVIDRGECMPAMQPHVVSDHINLCGSNPLVGPNDPHGERFPIINDIYITKFDDPALDALPRGIAGGVKSGVIPKEDEMANLRELGVDFCCYNLVPTMLVAAHAGWKVVALVIPDGAALDKPIADFLRGAI